MRPFGILLVLTLSLLATEPLTNDTVIRIVQAGVPTEVVLKTIRTADDFKFSMLPGDLTALGQAKVPEEIVKAMATRMNTWPTYAIACPITC